MLTKLFNKLFLKENFQSIIVMFLTVLASIIGIFNQKLIIQNFGANALEMYILVLSWFLLLSSFFTFGSRPTYISLRDNKNNLKNYFFSSILIGSLFSFFFGLLIFYFLYHTNNFEYHAFIKISIVPFFFFQTINIFFSYYFISIKKPILSILFTFLPIPLVSLFLYINLFNNLFLNLSIPSLIIMLFLTLFIYKFLQPVEWRPFILFNYFKNNFSKAFSFTIADIIDVLANRISIFFLAYIGNDLSEMVEFGIAFAFLKITMVGINSLSMVYSPQLYDSIKSSKKELNSIFNNMRFLFILVSILSCIAVFFVGELVISYFYTEKYIYAFKLLMILQIGQVIHSCFGPISLMGHLAGHPKEIAFYKLITICIMMGLNLITYDKFGIDVIAYNYILSLVLWNIIVYFRVRYLKS